jgi:hypothetical protein
MPYEEIQRKYSSSACADYLGIGHQGIDLCALPFSSFGVYPDRHEN